MYPVFHTITIKVPTEQIFIGKNGSISLVPTLTKSNALSKRLGMPSIILKKDEHILHAIIDNKGSIENYNETKERQKKLKIIKKRLSDLPLKKSTISKSLYSSGMNQLF